MWGKLWGKNDVKRCMNSRFDKGVDNKHLGLQTVLLRDCVEKYFEEKMY